MSISKQLEQKSNHIHQTLVQIAKESVTKEDFDAKKLNFLRIIEKDGHSYNPIGRLKR